MPTCSRTSPAGCPDEQRREQLREQAERLNPDSWVTDEEVTAGLEAYESVLASLRDVVGSGGAAPARPRGVRRPPIRPRSETRRTGQSGEPDDDADGDEPARRR